MTNSRHSNQIVTRVFLRVLLVAPLLIGLTLGSPFPQVAHAAIWTVTDCGDTGAPGQLRTLLNAAANGDTILVPSCTITLTPANGPLTVSATSYPLRITIMGAGAANTTISGGDAVGVFVVGPWDWSGLTLKNLTVSHGNSSNPGGGVAVLTWASLTVDGCTFQNNQAPDGGAISNMGVTNIANSTFLENFLTDPAGVGGAIWNGRQLNVTNSTFLENSALAGGGVYNDANTASVNFCTFWENSAAPGGPGAAVQQANGSVTLLNTIVATTNEGTNGNNCSGTITNGGYNIDSGTTCGWGTANGSLSSTNPQLGAVIGNPAYPPLQVGSPAIDLVPNSTNNCGTTITRDEPGNPRPRPAGGACDSGAYEAPALLISEVVYDPPAGCTEPDAEWVELYNAGGSAITLTNWQLCDDAGCDTIPTSTIQPHEGLVVAGAQTAFLTCYTCSSGHVVYVADGALGDGLGNDGDRVRLLDNNGTEVDAISYGADTYAFTPACPDVGEGHSLERYPIQQDTNAAGDFRDRSNPGPCQNPTAVGLARFAVRLSGWLLALLPALVALGLGGLLWARRNRGLSRQ